MAEGMSLWDYLKREVSYGYLLRGREDIYSEKQQRILTIMRTPRELEKLMLFGVGICFNSFLFIFSFLPIRIIWVGLTFLFRLLTCRSRWIDNTHKCDVARVILLITCTYAMRYVDTSQVYHLVRGQSVIKLYVIFNVLEIFDRLAASIGQDVLDSFYWVLTGSGSGSRKQDILPLVFYSIVATLYVCILREK